MDCECLNERLKSMDCDCLDRATQINGLWLSQPSDSNQWTVAVGSGQISNEEQTILCKMLVDMFLIKLIENYIWRFTCGFTTDTVGTSVNYPTKSSWVCLTTDVLCDFILAECLLCYFILRSCSVRRNHNPVLSSFITYHSVCNKSNMTGATRGTWTAHPSGAHEFAPGF
jgi:hypothetical protein